MIGGLLYSLPVDKTFYIPITTGKCIKGSTHYLGDKQDLNVLTEGRSSRISDYHRPTWTWQTLETYTLHQPCIKVISFSLILLGYVLEINLILTTVSLE